MGRIPLARHLAMSIVRSKAAVSSRAVQPAPRGSAVSSKAAFVFMPTSPLRTGYATGFWAFCRNRSATITDPTSPTTTRTRAKKGFDRLCVVRGIRVVRHWPMRDPARQAQFRQPMLPRQRNSESGAKKGRAQKRIYLGLRSKKRRPFHHLDRQKPRHGRQAAHRLCGVSRDRRQGQGHQGAHNRRQLQLGERVPDLNQGQPLGLDNRKKALRSIALRIYRY